MNHEELKRFAKWGFVRVWQQMPGVWWMREEINDVVYSHLQATMEVSRHEREYEEMYLETIGGE